MHAGYNRFKIWSPHIQNEKWNQVNEYAVLLKNRRGGFTAWFMSKHGVSEGDASDWTENEADWGGGCRTLTALLSFPWSMDSVADRASIALQFFSRSSCFGQFQRDTTFSSAPEEMHVVTLKHSLLDWADESECIGLQKWRQTVLSSGIWS